MSCSHFGWCLWGESRCDPPGVICTFQMGLIQRSHVFTPQSQYFQHQGWHVGVLLCHLVLYGHIFLGVFGPPSNIPTIEDKYSLHVDALLYWLICALSISIENFLLNNHYFVQKRKMLHIFQLRL